MWVCVWYVVVPVADVNGVQLLWLLPCLFDKYRWVWTLIFLCASHSTYISLLCNLLAESSQWCTCHGYWDTRERGAFSTISRECEIKVYEFGNVVIHSCWKSVKECVRSGIRTHAYMSRLRPERSALDRSAILTLWILNRSAHPDSLLKLLPCSTNTQHTTHTLFLNSLGTWPLRYWWGIVKKGLNTTLVSASSTAPSLSLLVNTNTHSFTHMYSAYVLYVYMCMYLFLL